MKNFKEELARPILAGVIAFGFGAERTAAQKGGDKDQEPSPAPLAQVVSPEDLGKPDNITVVENPGEVPPVGEEVVPPEAAPLEVMRLIGDTLVSIPIDHYERRGEQIVGVDAQGKVLVEQISDIEMRNVWFIRTLHSEGLPQYGSIPMDLSISYSFFDPTSINDLIGKLEQTAGANVYATDLKSRITAAADMRWHQSADTARQLNFDISWMANIRGTELAPIFQAPPQSGEEQLAAALLYLVSVGTGLSYPEAVAALQAQQPLAVELPNGETWDPSKGFHLINGRNFSAQQYTRMAASRAYTLSPETLIFIDHQGRLAIRVADFSTCSGSIIDWLIVALSEMTKHLGAPMLPLYEIDADIFAIMFSPVGNNQYTWPMDISFSGGPVVNQSSIRDTFDYR